MVLDNAPCHHGMLALRKYPCLGDQGTILPRCERLSRTGRSSTERLGKKLTASWRFGSTGLFCVALPKAEEEFPSCAAYWPEVGGSAGRHVPGYQIQWSAYSRETRAETYVGREGDRQAAVHPVIALPQRAHDSYCKNDVVTNSLGGGSLRVVHKALRRDACTDAARGRRRWTASSLSSPPPG